MPHIHTEDGQFDFTVSGYLIYKNKVLLIKHKYLPIWMSPGGHIELDQTPIDALFAEINEEAGIDNSHLELVETQPQKIFTRGEATALTLPFDLEYHTVIDGHRHINLSYIVRSDTDNVEPRTGESNTFKWFSAEELRAFAEINNSIRNLALYALDYISKLDNKNN